MISHTNQQHQILSEIANITQIIVHPNRVFFDQQTHSPLSQTPDGQIVFANSPKLTTTILNF